jgi:hypothetical protein
MTDSDYTPEFFAAWETFADEVTRAFKKDARPDEANRPLAIEQAKYIHASAAVAKLLWAVGEKETARKFLSLSRAMEDVVDGLPHRLFSVERPKTTGGRYNDAGEVWLLRSNLCVALEFLMAAGDDQDKAIAAAKKHRNQLKKLLRAGAKSLETSISTWLKKFATDEVDNEAALSGYKVGMEELAVMRLNLSEPQLRHMGHHLVTSAAARAARLS